MDPRAAGARRLVERHASEPYHGAWAFVRHMRDTYDLPLRVVLALTLMDPPTLRWIQEGGLLITSNCRHARAVGQFYSLIDMVDPLAGQIATAMMARSDMRGTVLLLTNL